MKIYSYPSEIPVAPYAPMTLPFDAIAVADADGVETMIINLVVQSRTRKPGPLPAFPILNLISIDPVSRTETPPQALDFNASEAQLTLASGAAAELFASYAPHPHINPAVRQIRIVLKKSSAQFTLNGSSWAFSVQFPNNDDDGTPAPSGSQLSFVVDGSDVTPSLLLVRPIRLGRDTADPTADHLIHKLLVGHRYRISSRPFFNAGFTTIPLELGDGRTDGPVTIVPVSPSLTPGFSTVVSVSIEPSVPGPFHVRFSAGQVIGTDTSGTAVLDIRGIADDSPTFEPEGSQFSQVRAQRGDVVRVIGDNMDGLRDLLLLGSPGQQFKLRADGSTRTAIQFTVPADAPSGSWLVALLVEAYNMENPDPAAIRQIDGADYLVLATSSQWFEIA